MRFIMELDLDNAVFDAETPALELARIFGEVTAKIANDVVGAEVIIDLNGNTIGQYEIANS